MSPSYGLYSAFEYRENAPLQAGKEAYLDSEKYQIRARDMEQPGIKGLIVQVNQIHKSNPALQELANIHFFDSSNDQIICYCKLTRDKSNLLIVVVTLNLFQSQEGTCVFRWICSAWTGGRSSKPMTC